MNPLGVDNRNIMLFSDAVRLAKEIEKKVDIEEYIKSLGVIINQTGHRDRAHCCCPLHKETAPSFVIYKNTNSFFCYGCHRGGSVINFAKLYHGWSWFKTIRYFASKCNLSITIDDSEIAERIYEEYMGKRNQKRSDAQSDDLAINYEISQLGKRLVRKYKQPQVHDMVENLFRIMDNIIMGGNVRVLTNDKKKVFSILEKYEKNIDKKQKEIDDLAKDNRLCTACFLRHQCRQVVVGEGNILSHAVILGEAPGKDEDEQGRPFVGASGQLLRKAIAECGFVDSSIWIDNVSNCRPPNNEFQKKEAGICKNLWLNKRLDYIKPQGIMLLGANACKTFLQQENFSMGPHVNTIMQHQLGDKKIEVWINYHPSYIVRTGGVNGENYTLFKSIVQRFLEKYTK